MLTLNRKPGRMWYVPPALAGGFFLLIGLGFSMYVFVVFAVPAVAIGIAVGSYWFLVFRNRVYAKEWSMIVGSWIASIMPYVLFDLFYCDWIGC